MEKQPKRKPKRPDMTLEQFTRHLHAKADEFAAMWRENHSIAPEDWPMQYKDGALESAEMQWSDQFRAWMGWDE